MFKRLTMEYIDLYGRDFIEKEMAKCIETDSNAKLVITSSQLIKEQNINHEPTGSESCNTFNINTLSCELIQLTASYLPFNDYITFRVSNRKIFLSLNQKCFLTVPHSFNIENIPNYGQKNIIHFNLNNFPNLTSIKLNLNTFNTQLSGQRVPTNINNLSISNAYGSTDVQQHEEIDYFGLFMVMHTNINDTHNYFGKLNSLSLVSFDIDEETHVDFNNFVQDFQSIKFLELTGVTVNNPSECKLLKFKNIEGLMIENSDAMLAEILIVNNANKLVSLTLDEDEFDTERINYISSQTYEKLEELKIYDGSLDTLNNLLSSCNNLRRILLGNACLNDDDNDFKKLIEKIIKLECLEYLKIETDFKRIGIVSKGVQRGLRNINKNKFKIDLDFDLNDPLIFDCEYIEDDILINVINALNQSNINDFMLLCEIYIQYLPIESINKMEELMNKEMEQSKCIMHTYKIFENNNHIYRFVISNEGCKICGYFERWDALQLKQN